MKTDKSTETELSGLASKIRFNVIDTREKVGTVISFKIDKRESEFIEGFCTKYNFKLSEACRFFIDVIYAMDNGGMLEEFIRQFSEFKKRETK